MAKLEKTVMESELGLARKRLVSQQALLAQAELTLEYAERTALPALVKATKARIERYRRTMQDTMDLVKDLEKASGSLPLK